MKHFFYLLSQRLRADGRCLCTIDQEGLEPIPSCEWQETSSAYWIGIDSKVAPRHKEMAEVASSFPARARLRW